MKPLNPLVISGREVLPLVEGGKGISVSNGESSGRLGRRRRRRHLLRGQCRQLRRDAGQLIPQVYFGRTRRERHEELVAYAIAGGIQQARVAYERGGGQGRIHMNVLWEMAAAERILHGVLEGAQAGSSTASPAAPACPTGSPRSAPAMASTTIRSSRRRAPSARLWKRAYHKFRDWLGGVVYEDPWLAGGHNGLSNSEDPERPEPPFPRVHELRAA